MFDIIVRRIYTILDKRKRRRIYLLAECAKRHASFFPKFVIPVRYINVAFPG